MILLAQDPSFAGLGFSLYDGKQNIFMDCCRVKFKSVIGFESVFLANMEIYNLYSDKLRSVYKLGIDLELDCLFSEIPPPTGIFSAGLFSLDTFLIDHLSNDFLKKGGEIYTIPPSFLMTLHNKKGYKKSESVVIAKYLIDDVLSDDFSYSYSGRLNADIAESFLFLVRSFCRFNIKGVRDKVVNAIPGYFSETEKLLLRRA